MRLLPASGRSAPCVRQRILDGYPVENLSYAPDPKKNMQYSIAIDIEAQALSARALRGAGRNAYPT